MYNNLQIKSGGDYYKNPRLNFGGIIESSPVISVFKKRFYAYGWRCVAVHLNAVCALNTGVSAGARFIARQGKTPFP